MSNDLNQLTQTPLIQPGTSDKLNWPWVQYFNGLKLAGGASGVTSLNALVGALSLIAGPNITITPAGLSIQISATSVVVPVFAPPETPTDSGDHQNFTLTQTPNPSTNLALYLNGMWQLQGVGDDYTLSGNTITLANALSGSFNLVTGPYQY